MLLSGNQMWKIQTDRHMPDTDMGKTECPRWLHKTRGSVGWACVAHRHFNLIKLYAKPSIGASYQISINLAKRFLEKIFFNWPIRPVYLLLLQSVFNQWVISILSISAWWSKTSIAPVLLPQKSITFCKKTTIPGIILSLASSNWNNVCGDLIKILDLPYATSFSKCNDLMIAFVPSNSFPLNVGHVWLVKHLYLKYKKYTLAVWWCLSKICSYWQMHIQWVHPRLWPSNLKVPIFFQKSYRFYVKFSL